MLAFLLTAVAISLSGVLAPGPITAAALAAGSRHRHAGALIAVGHAAIEIPLILLLAAGVGTCFESPAVRAAIGLAGGAFLLLMGVQLLLSLRNLAASSEASVQRHPFWTGVVVTGANPYFIVWWATVGLTLTSQAMALGVCALALFVLIHFLCDLGWLETLSLAGFQGSEWFGLSAQRIVIVLCAAVLLAFGVKFLYDATLLGR